MAGLCVVLLLYLVLISLALATWGKLSDGFDEHKTTKIACQVMRHTGQGFLFWLMSALFWSEPIQYMYMPRRLR